MTSSHIVPVVGTVGVPARYGGFETLAEQLCMNMPAEEIELLVYCEGRTYAAADRAARCNGHARVFLPLRANGIASLFYDALALLHATFVVRAHVVLIFGYSGAWLLPLLRLVRPRTRYIVNVDGMEWRRNKFSWPAKILLKALEYCAARCASIVIADNDALASLFRDRYAREPVTIAYGGDHTLVPTATESPPSGHFLAIARIEPENNTEMILEACRRAGVRLVFIGNWDASEWSAALRGKYRDTPGFQLLDPIYDQTRLDPWRRGAQGYIHGHSVGGTNPSLVEALFHAEAIISFDCVFNRASLQGEGQYFKDVTSLTALLSRPVASIEAQAIAALRERYRWKKIAAQYCSLLPF